MVALGVLGVSAAGMAFSRNKVSVRVEALGLGFCGDHEGCSSMEPSKWLGMADSYHMPSPPWHAESLAVGEPSGINGMVNGLEPTPSMKLGTLDDLHLCMAA